jgi:4-amino-4-deoxy-L-arabinose transferase-like glycosyltransferase
MKYIKYILLLLFVATHFIRLTALPVFTDETNYIDWGWRETHLAGYAFYSLYDAKQPLAMWLFGWSQSLFKDPVFASRFVSVWTGLFTALAIYSLARKLHSEKIALLSLAVYSFCHYFFFFDRQALVESTSMAIFSWTGYVLFAFQNLTWKKSALLGLLFGLGYLTKSNSLLVTASTLLILLWQHRAEIKENFGRAMLTGIIILAVTLVIVLPMILHPWFGKYIHLSTQYTFTVSQLISFPVAQWWKNVSATFSILFWFFTPALFVSIILGIKKSKMYSFALWCLLPLIIQFFIAKFLVSRYLISYVPLLVIPAAYFIELQKKNLKYLLLGLIFIPNLLLIGMQIVSPPDYFRVLSKVTKYSYIEGYVTTEAGGYSLVEGRKYVEYLASKQPILLGLALFSGNPEVGFLNYYRNDPRIRVTYLDAMLMGDSLKEVDCMKFDRPTYLISRTKDGAGLLKYFELDAEITNPYSNSIIYVFKVKENCVGNTLELNSNY